MVSGQLIKYRVDDCLRHNHLNIIECLLRVFSLHGLNDLFIVFSFLGGQLTHASLGQDGHILLIHHFSCLLQDVLLDFLAEFRESLAEHLGVIILDGLVHLLHNLGFLHC